MRILWVAPWARPLARVYADALAAQGHEVLVVTSAQHYEHAAPRADELVVTGSVKHPGSYGSAVSAYRRARAFAPEVVVTEEFTDPRLLPLLRLAPVATLVHDDSPHDSTEERSLQHRLVFARATARAELLLTFSEFVAGHARARWTAPVTVLPLPSDCPVTPDLVPASGRRDMVVLGRINPYKDLPTTLAAWARHVEGPGYRGDELLVIGDGNEDDLVLPAHTTWRRERFQFAEVAPVLARAKASIVHYRSATQSGVQVTSMHCGVATIVSDAGGLAEYLPPHQHPVPVGDVAGLAAAMDRLADPQVAADAGAAARAHHDNHFAVGVAAAALAAAVAPLVASRK